MREISNTDIPGVRNAPTKPHRQGLIFTGIDVIGGYLTEINVTSPTGLQEIDRFDQVNLEGEIWDVIERRHAETRPGLPV